MFAAPKVKSKSTQIRLVFEPIGAQFNGIAGRVGLLRGN
jgi:hypothetical protein